MIHGLHFDLAGKIAKRAAGQLLLADEEISPNERHSLEWTAADLDREIHRLSEAIRDTTAIGEAIAELLCRLTEIPHNSRHQSLVFTHLEEAHSRVLRELGDRPEKPL